MTLLLLAGVAAFESVAWLYRMRTGVGACRWRSAAAAALVCGSRVVWLWAGVQATLAGDALIAGTVYVLAAAAATAVVHGRART